MYIRLLVGCSVGDNEGLVVGLGEGSVEGAVLGKAVDQLKQKWLDMVDMRICFVTSCL